MSYASLHMLSMFTQTETSDLSEDQPFLGGFFVLLDQIFSEMLSVLPAIYSYLPGKESEELQLSTLCRQENPKNAMNIAPFSAHRYYQSPLKSLGSASSTYHLNQFSVFKQCLLKNC